MWYRLKLWLRQGVGVSLALSLAACGGGAEVMGISSLPRLDPYPTSADQWQALDQEANALAYSAGARGQYTSVTWRQLEPHLDQMDESELKNVQGQLDRAQATGMTSLVTIQLINTARRELPAELATEPFDSPAMKSRFHKLLDKLIVPNKGKIKYLSIGNEVDCYLHDHPLEWAPYKDFYVDAANYARSLDPAIQVGVTATGYGALNGELIGMQSLNEASDVVIFTYYPLLISENYTIAMKPPSVVASDFKRMLEVAGTHPLVMQEVGYAAAAISQGSEDLQAEFVGDVFDVWKANRDRMPFLNFFMLHDFPVQTCNEFAAYFKIAHPDSFKGFFCSLGFVQSNGVPRKAWSTLQLNAAAMGLGLPPPPPLPPPLP